VANRHANILDDPTFTKLLAKVAAGEHSLRDQTMLLLSYKAGLRAQEIAGLKWANVCDANGDVRREHFFVPSSIAKGAKEATLPLHPHLYILLTQLRAARPDAERVIYALTKQKTYAKHMTPASVKMWFQRLYREHELEGCSSHSGRRTFITRLARKAGQFDCSIKDVQLMARHANLGTTERYIEPSEHVGRLVSAI
jgi:integrase